MNPSSLKSSSPTRLLEITVISGENLLENRKQPVKKNAFVKIKAESSLNVQTTKMDKEGGSCPAWDEILIVDLPMHASHLTMEVQCKNSSGIKTVGIVRVPTSDFIGGFLPEDCLHFLSYRLRDEKGVKNGIINFSVRVKNAPPRTAGCAAAYSRQWTAAPVDMGSRKGSYGVVTGVPAYYGSFTR